MPGAVGGSAARGAMVRASPAKRDNGVTRKRVIAKRDTARQRCFILVPFLDENRANISRMTGGTEHGMYGCAWFATSSQVQISDRPPGRHPTGARENFLPETRF